jgi:uncharacterized membrane protein YgaE (UPF0421/DUF939 family)
VRSLAWRLLLVGWPGTRVFKTGLATALAWLAGNSFGDPAPMFAVFGALNGMQPTVAASARSIVGGLLGIVLGTLLAATSEGLVHAPQAVLVGVLVALGLVASVRLHVYELLGTEVAVSGVVVYALSGGSLLWGAGRLAETALGGCIALLVNALILPPDYRSGARAATSVLAEALTEQLQTAMRDAMAPSDEAVARAHASRAQATAQQADTLIAQTARAAEALRFSPWLRYRPYRRISTDEVERYTSGVEALASGLAHARTATRAAWHASRRTARRLPPSGDWQGLCSDLGAAIDRFQRYVLDGNGPAFEAADVALRFAMRKHAEVVAAAREQSRAWDIDRAAVLAEVEHVLDDLRRALRERAPATP